MDLAAVSGDWASSGSHEFIDFYLRLARQQARNFSFLDAGDEYRNFFTAMGKAERLGRVQELIELLVLLGSYCITRGLWAPWLRLGDGALGTPAGPGIPRKLARLLFLRGRVLFRLARYDALEHCLWQAQLEGEREHDPSTLASLEYMFGALARKRKDFERSRRHCMKSYTMMQALGEEYGQAIALYNAAAVEEEDVHGDRELAIEHLSQCIGIFQRLERWDRMGRTWIRLGRMMAELGDYTRATKYLEHAEAALARTHADGRAHPKGSIDAQPRDFVILQTALARALRGQGQDDEAFWRADQARELAKKFAMTPQVEELTELLGSLGQLSE